LTTWHCILSAKLTKDALLQTVFWQFCSLGSVHSIFVISVENIGNHQKCEGGKKHLMTRT